MNVIQAIQEYITKMISNIPGMKVLLLDKETMGIVSMVYSQSQILQKEVFLFERLDIKNREVMTHLKAVCFLRPTVENKQLLEDELKEPKYGEYHIFFSNTVRNSYLEELAESDEFEAVHQLQEFFADYFAVNHDTFTLNLERVITVQQPEWRLVLDRTVDGIASCLLSLKKQPYIRYSGKSEIVSKVISEMQRRVQQEPSLFDFRKQETPPLLLLLDRRDDPVTPLLNQWTYQGMVHELLGLSNNRVDMSKVPGVKSEMAQIVLSSEQDPWFKQTMYDNFGDLGVKVKDLVDDYQSKTKSNQNIESIEDIKRFVESYPEFRKLSGNVTKHVTLMGELSRMVEKNQLLRMSEIEQELANAHDHSNHARMVREALTDAAFTKHDRLKLVMLYSLRYEGHTASELQSFLQIMQDQGFSSDQLASVSAVLRYAGASSRSGDLFGGKSIIRNIKNITRGLKGVANIYTEHKPLLKSLLDMVLANRLREADYPFATGSATRDAPQDIIVFIVGGATFEEALTVHEFNASGTGVRIILGGTTIHNSRSFLKDISILESSSLR